MENSFSQGFDTGGSRKRAGEANKHPDNAAMHECDWVDVEQCEGRKNFERCNREIQRVDTRALDSNQETVQFRDILELGLADASAERGPREIDPVARLHAVSAVL